MKKYIKSTIDSKLTNQSLVKLLESKGIDTTKAKYELKAQRYERYTDGGIYTLHFTCPGDYLAYFSMAIHKQPNSENIYNYYFDEFEDILDTYPTVEDIADHASSSWWGDGDDYIIHLKNLTTDEYLYGPEEVEEEYDEEDWED